MGGIIFEKRRALQFLTAFTFLFAATTALRADRWESRATGPERRTGNTAVWTGTEMIVWGGGRQSQWLGDGARYNLASDTWRTLPTINAPEGRWFHVAVWTGKEMIVWGGRASFYPQSHYGDGAKYNPQTDTWTPVSNVNAPSPRSQMMAIWTGTEMIVWGGTGDGWNELNDGARYNPETDTWTPMTISNAPAGRFEHTAVWTGNEMIVFGGLTIHDQWVSKNTGGRYNPATDSWTALPTDGAPNTAEQVAVWTGTDMIVWGGRTLPSSILLDRGARYNLASNTWTPLSAINAPSPRTEPASVWTGTEMIVWCGSNDQGGQNDGARYNPSSDIWTPMTNENAPHKRFMWRPDLGLWTGEGLLVYGGSDYPYEVDNTDYYVPYAPPPPPTAPDILEQPHDLSLMEGDAASLTVIAGGTRPLSYQWLLEGVEIAGATASTLSFQSVQLSQGGHYSVVVTNIAGSVTSQVATLTIHPARVLEIGAVPAQQEGTSVSLPLRLISEGDVGGMTFSISYNPAYLSNPQLTWDSSISSAFEDANTNQLGNLTGTLALPATAIPGGTQEIGQLTFFIRSVPGTLATPLYLNIQDLSDPSGETLSGNITRAPQVNITGRKYIGDNNANDRLDVGDATVVLRYLANLDPVRSWDISLNNVNQNTGLDSGDVIRILRASAGIDPQPQILVPPPRGGKSISQSFTGLATLTPALIQSAPGQNITVQLNVANIGTPISGAAFQLNYDTNALRLVSATSYKTGTLVPASALSFWNVTPAQTNFASQDGHLVLAVSSATAWSGNQGVLSEVTFQVQPGAAAHYLSPITISQMEITEDGYKNHALATTGAAVTVRPPVPGRLLANSSSLANGQFSLSLSGDAGASYVVEVSSDLLHWSDLASVSNNPGTTLVTDPDAAAHTHRFYRVRVGP
ncbi:MAG TPA: cohesin domain-containing protein [Candidatus Saccharimonadales bacterium]|nr:cohesin domain-containing protein [Candidatus Saccharimonadales bacterium]